MSSTFSTVGLSINSIRPPVSVRSGSDAVGREQHRVDDVLVAGAPAKIAAEVLADLLLARPRVLAKQRLDGHQEPRRAEAALQPVRLTEGFLDGMEPTVWGKALDRAKVRAIHLNRKEEARSHWRA